jgi:hypothetical protein
LGFGGDFSPEQQEKMMELFGEEMDEQDDALATEYTLGDEDDVRADEPEKKKTKKKKKKKKQKTGEDGDAVEQKTNKVERDPLACVAESVRRK